MIYNIMKIALITDLHFGVRNDNKFILAHQEVFFEKTFFPYIKKYDIQTVINLGDTFDKRRSINTDTLDKVDAFFFNPMSELGIDYTALLGNHDVFYKNTNSVNTPKHLKHSERGFEYIESSPVVKEFDGLKIGLIPWITNDNQDEVMKFIDSKKYCPHVVFGHFEIKGFQMYRGIVAEHGLSSGLFDRFHMTLSGHFHHKSTVGNIHYLGSPYQMTWMDHSDPRGFHILDTETLKLEFVRNPINMFEKVDFSGKSDSDIDNIDMDRYDNTFVKMTVGKDTPGNIIEKLRSKFVDSKIADFKLDESAVMLAATADSMLDGLDDIGDVEDLIGFLDEVVDADEDVSEDRDKVKRFLKELYVEASNI